MKATSSVLPSQLPMTQQLIDLTKNDLSKKHRITSTGSQKMPKQTSASFKVVGENAAYT
jgi:hypothetical protein